MLEGELTVPFVKGVAMFTRLRVDKPGEDLTLMFTTTPERFEATTVVRFTVVAPPQNTPNEEVSFLLEGDVGRLPDDQQVLVESVRVGISSQLDVDISRVQDVRITVRE